MPKKPAHEDEQAEERWRLRALADSVEYMTEEDFCLLCGITPSTSEAWRKGHTGPSYSLAGNRYLYPREAVRRFLDDNVRERGKPSTL